MKALPPSVSRAITRFENAVRAHASEGPAGESRARFKEVEKATDHLKKSIQRALAGRSDD